MKKLLRSLFSGKSRMERLIEPFELRLKEMQAEFAAQAAFDAAWLEAMEAEHTLTAGRPVTLLQPSQTLH